MKRILYVNHEVEMGGAERSLLELISGLDRDRFEPHLALSRPGPLSEAVGGQDVKLHYVPMLFDNRLRKLFGMFRASLRLRKLIRAEKIDLVHTNSLIAGYCGSLAARLCNVPCIWHVRDIGYPAPARQLAAKCDMVLANSRATADSLLNGANGNGRGDAKADVQVVYNGVADAFFDAPPSDEARRWLHRELDLAPEEHLVGMVGRLDPWKGHGEFLDAAKQVLVKRDDVTFLIVGGVLFDGARQRLERYQHQLESHARRIGIFGKVRFLGQREDVPRLLSAMEVVVHPSQLPEPFGRTIAEAHATGRPVVASNLGGIPEIVEEGQSGYLCDPEDSGAMATRILDLLENPADANRMGQRGRAAAEERFRRKAHVAQVQELYLRLLG